MMVGRFDLRLQQINTATPFPAVAESVNFYVIHLLLTSTYQNSNWAPNFPVFIKRQDVSTSSPFLMNPGQRNVGHGTVCIVSKTCFISQYMN